MPEGDESDGGDEPTPLAEEVLGDVEEVDTDQGMGPETLPEGVTSDADERRPLAISELFATSTRRALVDFFLTQTEPGEQLNKSQIAERADVGRSAIYENLDVLVQLGVIEETGGEPITYYRTAETDAVAHLVAANAALVQSWEERVGT